MIRLARPLFVVAIIGAVAAPAVAQTTTAANPPTQTRSLAPSVAAATLPNSFDRPARPAAVIAPAAPVTPAPAEMPTADQVAQAQRMEGVLRSVIADLAESRLDAALFTPALAERLTPQLPTLGPVVQEFGTLGTIEPQGATNGANQFLVTFENAVTQWVIGLTEDDRVSVLLFRPAPPASSEPDPETTEPEEPAATVPAAGPSGRDR